MFESVGAAGLAKGYRAFKAMSLKFVDCTDRLWFWHDAEVGMSSFACCMLCCHHPCHFTPHVSLNNVALFESQRQREFVERSRDIFNAAISIYRWGDEKAYPGNDGTTK
jgi:hypothetical protein